MKNRYISQIVLAAALAVVSAFHAFAQTSVVRLKVVNVPVDSGLLAAVLPDFERTTGYRVEVDKRGDDLYDVVRQGTTDLAISHYGHPGVEPFLAEDLGRWPRTVFSNQAVLLGPPSDPAGIHGIQDAIEAFKRIAETKSRFLVNNAATEKYLGQILWEGAGRVDLGEWYIDRGLRDQPAIQAAESMGAYVLWGVVPFLKFKEASQSTLEALVTDDPLFQRIMVSIVPDPAKFAGINLSGGVALQTYLAAPATQAKIRAFRYPGFDHQLFWPAARDNSPSFLSAIQPAATTISFDAASVRAGGTMSAIFAGTNISEQTYFDVRFRAPGATTDDVALNWQYGSSAMHTISAGTAAGTWMVTGLRAHDQPNDHSAPYVSVSTNVTVLP